MRINRAPSYEKWQYFSNRKHLFIIMLFVYCFTHQKFQPKCFNFYLFCVYPDWLNLQILEYVCKVCSARYLSRRFICLIALSNFFKNHVWRKRRKSSSNHVTINVYISVDTSSWKWRKKQQIKMKVLKHSQSVLLFLPQQSCLLQSNHQWCSLDCEF